MEVNPFLYLFAALSAGISAIIVILALAIKDIQQRGFISSESRTGLEVWLVGMLSTGVGVFLQQDLPPAGRIMSFLLTVLLSGLSVYYTCYDSVTRTDVAAWLRSLGILLQSQMRIDQALDLLSRSCPSRKLALISRIIKRGIMEGEPLSYMLGLKGIGEVFGGVVQTAVQGGERRGNLPDVLIELSDLTDFYKSKANVDADAPHAESIYTPIDEFSGIEIPDIRKLRKPLEHVDMKAISGAASAYTSAEQSDPARRIRQLALSSAPGVRVILTIFRMATAEGVPEIFLAMEETRRFRGMKVSFKEKTGDVTQVMTIPMHVASAALNELKLLADIPYWQRNTARSSFVAHYEGKPYRLTIRLAELNGEETARIAIEEEIVGLGSYADLPKAS